MLSGRPEACAAGDPHLELNSIVLGNDPRVLETKRVITVEGDSLRYAQFMATTTTGAPVMQRHLEAVLRRDRG